MVDDIVSQELMRRLVAITKNARELHVRKLVSYAEIASLQITLPEFEQRIVAPYIARAAAEAMVPHLMSGVMVSGSRDNDFGYPSTEYRTQIAVLTSEELTTLCRICNALVAAYGDPNEMKDFRP